MVLDFFRRSKRPGECGEANEVTEGSYRRTRTPEVDEEQEEVLRYTAWSPGQDPDSSLITLALDSRLTSDSVKRMRRQSSVQSLHKAGLTLLRQRKLFKSSYSVCEASSRALSQSASCLVNVVGGSVEELSDSGYSSWEGGTGEGREESDSDSGLGTLTRPPPSLVSCVLAAYPHLHPQLRAVFRQENPEELDLVNSPADTSASQLVSRLEEQLRGRKEEVASSVASLREEKAELEMVASQVEGKLVSFRTVRRLLDFCSDLDSVGSLAMRVEVRGEGSGRLGEVQGWLAEREVALERGIEWELGEGWADTWRGYVRGKRAVVARLCRLSEEARNIEAQLRVLATLN